MRLCISIRGSVRLLVHPSIGPSVHRFVRRYICPSVGPSIRFKNARKRVFSTFEIVRGTIGSDEGAGKGAREGMTREDASDGRVCLVLKFLAIFKLKYLLFCF